MLRVFDERACNISLKTVGFATRRLTNPAGRETVPSMSSFRWYLLAAVITVIAALLVLFTPLAAEHPAGDGISVAPTVVKPASSTSAPLSSRGATTRAAVVPQDGGAPNPPAEGLPASEASLQALAKADRALLTTCFDLMPDHEGPVEITATIGMQEGDPQGSVIDLDVNAAEAAENPAVGHCFQSVLSARPFEAVSHRVTVETAINP